MKNWIIKKLGGFTSTDDFIERVNELDYSDKHKILTRAVKKSFTAIDEDDILTSVTDQKWIYAGRELTQLEINSLKEFAESFKNSLLFQVLDKDLKYQANRKMFIESKNTEDLIAGKLLLYLWDVVKTRLKRI